MSYAWLPELLEEIAGVAGLDAALAIADRWGGVEVYIPAQADDGHWLVATVGRAAADKLCRHFSSGHGGVFITLPLGPRGNLAKVRARVDQMIADNKPIREIALAAGYTSRGVERRKAKLRRANDKQGSLF